MTCLLLLSRVLYSYHLNETDLCYCYSFIQDSKPLNIWQYEQKMSAIEEEEQQRIEFLKEQREALLQEPDALDQTLDSLSDAAAPIPQEVRESTGGIILYN